MKKLFALLLTLALLLSSAAMAEFDYTGLWTLTGAEMAGTFVDAAVLGLDARMLLKEDGSYVLTMQGVAENGTWIATTAGITVTDAAGIAETIKLVDNNLVAEQVDMKLIFTRGAEEGINYVGEWALTSMKTPGVTLDSEQLSMYGMKISLSVREDGTCILISVGEDGDEIVECTWEETESGIVLTDMYDISLTFTFANGALTAEEDGAEMSFTPVESAE